MELKQQKEKVFHDKAFSEGTRDRAVKFYTAVSGSRDFYDDFLLANSSNKDVLEYGCGPGFEALFIAKTASTVTGIDISDTAIEQATERGRRERAENVTFRTMDAESMDFDDQSFDLICGMGILHHLDLHKSLSEIARTLRPGGKAIFIEPLGHNPLINLYRKVTPGLRTEDEHPLLMRDLKSMKSYFRKVEPHYFHFGSILAVPFRKLPGYALLLKTLDAADGALFKLMPFARKYAWQVVIVFSQPIKNAAHTSAARTARFVKAAGR
ncbi:MAG TPA: methyltransferase domain-containing protein [Blastocatellia bacterium]